MAEEKNAQDTQEAKGEQAGTGSEAEPEITIESVMAELAKARAESAKNKAALDKALHNNGELTRQLRAKMSASEQEQEAKRAAEEEQKNRIKELEDYKRRSEAKERFMTTMGMPPELAKEAADAEVAGDMEALTSVHKRHTDAILKASREQWLKERPEAASGHDEGHEKEDPFLAGFNMGY